MATISPDADFVTVMARFRVDAADQQCLIDLIAQTDPVLIHLPGFVSSSIHRSLDGSEVVAYLQWRSLADHEACVENLEMNQAGAGLMEFINAGRANLEVHHYRVTSTLCPT